jgi:hypothetical protein
MKELGEVVFNDTAHFQNANLDYCYDVPQETVEFNGTVVFQNSLLGVTPVCEFNSAQSDMAWFNVLYSYSFPENFTYGFGPFLSWLSLIALTIYFVTSSDSGSLIVDHLASNGYPETHWTQRVFWAFTEGALATALLVAGGSDGLRALQAASILTGLPFTFFLVYMCVGSYKMLLLAEKDNKEGTNTTLKEEFYRHKVFKMPVFGGVFNIFEYLIGLGIVHEDRKLVMPMPRVAEWAKFLVALFAPFVPYYHLLNAAYPKRESKKSNMAMCAAYALFHLTWIALFCVLPVSNGFQAFGWTSFMLAGCTLCHLRSSIRETYRIDGNLLHDLLMSSLLWPQVISQLSVELADANHHVDDDAAEEDILVKKTQSELAC